jgi:ligand-binding sensor domain-containing protein
MKFRISLTLSIVILIIYGLGCQSSSTGSTDSGPQWVTFSKTTSPKMLDDNIYTIHLIQRNNILFGTDSGVVTYQSGVWGYFPPDSFAYKVTLGGGTVVTERKVTAITLAYSMSYWFGSGNGQVIRYMPNTTSNAWQKYNLGASVIRGISYCLYPHESVCVAAYPSGAYQYVFPDPPGDPALGQFEILPANSGVTSGDCRVTTGRAGNLYFGTGMAKISWFGTDDDNWHAYTLLDDYASPIIALSVDWSGTIWCGKMSGVTSYNPELDSVYSYTPDNTGGKLPLAPVNAVETDKQYNTRWFGTNLGLAQLKDSTWTLFNTSNTPALPSNRIQALAYDIVNRDLWIGTDKGVVVYNEGGVTLK